eukprot:11162505-Lingulodinium_polyedra.AAC.1
MAPRASPRAAPSRFSAEMRASCARTCTGMWTSVSAGSAVTRSARSGGSGGRATAGPPAQDLGGGGGSWLPA